MERILSKQEFEKLYYQDGLTYREIGELYGHSIAWVSKFAKEYGIKPRGLRSPEANEKRKQTMLARYGCTLPGQTPKSRERARERFTGENLKEMRKKFQDKYGVSNRSQIGYRKEAIKLMNSREAMLEYIQTYHPTTQQIADYCGCRFENIEHKLHAWGLWEEVQHNYVGAWGSKEEDEIMAYVTSLGFTPEKNRWLIAPKELDIWVKEKRVAIEFNGGYWHSDVKVPKEYHIQKSLECEEENVFLLHIFEWEWAQKKDIMKSIVANALGVTPYKISARKTEVRTPSTEELKEFLNNNHRQGYRASSEALGLYYEGELVSVMTFTRPRYGKVVDGESWELSRFCSKLFTSVIGGASKLFKAFRTKYPADSIISYSDIAHTRGRLYEILGFELRYRTKPNYVWFKRGEVLSRHQCQMPNEDEEMRKRSYYKVYDCGSLCWIYHPTK